MDGPVLLAVGGLALAALIVLRQAPGLFVAVAVSLWDRAVLFMAV